MAGLGETTAALARLRRGRNARPLASGRPGRLKPVEAFGANPGQLQMLLHAPTGLGRQRPLVVVLHGCTQTAEAYADGAGWLTLADRHGFAVLCPQQQSANNANLCFNWFEPGDTHRGQGEAASIRSMVEAALRQLDGDRARVFVTGLSAGGAMASAMLAAYPEVFAGGGIVAGLPYGVAQGMPQAFAAMFQDSLVSSADLGGHVRAASAHQGPWPRVSVWHGEADTTVKPSNANDVIAQWADVHGLSTAPSHSRRAGARVSDAWTRDGAVVLERHMISGLGHGVPVAADGADGAGRPGPFILEAGVSSSGELLTFWGIAEASATKAEDAAETAPAIPITRLREQPERAGADARPDAHETGVGAIINKALRAAGLL